MRKELDEALCAKYPEIFRDRHGDPRQTAMVFGLDCGDGWYNIINALCAVIVNHLRNNRSQSETVAKFTKQREMALNGDWSFLSNSPWLAKDDNLEKEKQRMLAPLPDWMQRFEEVPEVVAVQVKEKFGTLRFYTNGGDEYIYGAISMAEALSAATCETCGAPGKLRGIGWLYTACDAHTRVEDLDVAEESEDDASH